MTTPTPAAVLAATITRVAAEMAEHRDMPAEFTEALDQLREMAEGAQGESADELTAAWLAGIHEERSRWLTRPAAVAPDGWVMVPRAPTAAMLECMDKGSAHNTWRNMLDAAPTPPSSKGDAA